MANFEFFSIDPEESVDVESRSAFWLKKLTDVLPKAQEVEHSKDNSGTS